MTPLEREPNQDPYDPKRTSRALCRACHIAKTRREENRRPPTEAETAWRALVTEMIEE